jgi:hypothetical protein
LKPIEEDETERTIKMRKMDNKPSKQKEVMTTSENMSDNSEISRLSMFKSSVPEDLERSSNNIDTNDNLDDELIMDSES